MAMRGPKSTKTIGNGANGFPAEAGEFFEEVTNAKLKELRLESDAAFPEEEWEVVDGFVFPYDKCA